MKTLIPKNPFPFSIVPLSIVAIIIATMLCASCENDINDINSLSSIDSLPVESGMDIRVTESKNGLIQYSLTSPKLDHYLGKEPYLEFPEGFHIVFFDSTGAISSEITANYGINYEKKEIMEAQSNVVVINREKEEQLNTEQLIWDQKKHLIYTDKFVKITTKDKIIYGENGLESDEKFENWTLRKVRGDIMLDKDEI